MTLRWNWGAGITLVYVAFVIGTVAFVLFAVGQRVDLVSDDYYARSLTVDADRAARARAAALPGFSAAIAPDGREVILTWPEDQRGAIRGAVQLYRGSNAADDRSIVLAPDGALRQTVSLASLPAGRWVLRVSWESGGRDYYAEYPVNAR